LQIGNTSIPIDGNGSISSARLAIIRRLGLNNPALRIFTINCLERNVSFHPAGRLGAFPA
jgi:hypothetical protein